MTNIHVSDMQRRHLDIINFVSMIIDSNNSVWDDATKRAGDDDDDAVESVACDDTLDNKTVLTVDSGTDDDSGMLLAHAHSLSSSASSVVIHISRNVNYIAQCYFGR